LEERAKRLFATKDKSFEDIDPSLFMKDVNKTKRGKLVFRFLNKFKISLSKFSKETTRHRDIAGMEAQIYRLVDLLGEQRLATLENVRRKQARAGEDNEDDEDVEGGDISDDDSDPEEDGLIYNPKNLPLGWDGKVKKKTN
jgi:splicing factor 3A subunit 3